VKKILFLFSVFCLFSLIFVLLGCGDYESYAGSVGGNGNGGGNIQNACVSDFCLMVPDQSECDIIGGFYHAGMHCNSFGYTKSCSDSDDIETWEWFVLPGKDCLED